MRVKPLTWIVIVVWFSAFLTGAFLAGDAWWRWLACLGAGLATGVVVGLIDWAGREKVTS